VDLSSIGSFLRGLSLDVPVDPDAPEAQRLIVAELSKAEYQNAKPSWFDRLASAFFDWLSSLNVGGIQGPPAFGFVIIIVVVVAGLAVAFLIFGVPRLNRKSSVSAQLFGEHDERNSAQIRAAAEAAAKQGNYSIAIAEMFRAIARGLAERTVVTTSPGTTARDFAARAASAFPESALELASAGSAFDDVRYLNREGTEQQFQHVAALESRLRTSKAILKEPVPA
jgi:Domain of unknown function (DUF4129)